MSAPKRHEAKAAEPVPLLIEVGSPSWRAQTSVKRASRVVAVRTWGSDDLIGKTVTTEFGRDPTPEELDDAARGAPLVPPGRGGRSDESPSRLADYGRAIRELESRGYRPAQITVPEVAKLLHRVNGESLIRNDVAVAGGWKAFRVAALEVDSR